jgi:dolichol-phosphate mannosyltransferase
MLLMPPVLAYQCLADKASRPRWTVWAVYIGIATLVPAPWYVAMAARDPAYLGHFLWKANIQRFIHPYDHEQPWWFYVPVLFLATFPWSLLWPALGYMLFSQRPVLAARRTPALGFCLMAVTWCLAFFSLSGCKSPPYVLPALAPLALLLGWCLEALLWRPVAQFHPILAHSHRLLARNATLVVLLGAAATYGAAALAGWQSGSITVVGTLLPLALALAWWRYGRQVGPLGAWGGCFAAVLGFIAFPLQDIGAGYAARHSPATITRLIRRWPTSRQSPIVSFQRTWLSASFYLHREIASFYGEHIHQEMLELFRKQPEVLVFVENGQNLDDFLKELPPTLDRQVILPDPDGTVALVIVRQPGEASSSP